MGVPARHGSPWETGGLHPKGKQLSYPLSSNQSQRLNPKRAVPFIDGLR
jgi:hypothetical protein